MHDLYGAGFDQIPESPAGKLILSCRHRCIQSGRYLSSAFQIVGVHRFFKPVGIVSLHHTAEPYRRIGVPGVVGIDHELNIRPDRVANSPHPLNVFSQRDTRPAHFHLDGPKAVPDVTFQLRCKLLDSLPLSVVSPRRIDPHPILGTSGELPDGLPEYLALEVP